MTKYYAYYLKHIGWGDSDGSDEAASFFGYGDYSSTICVPILEMEAENEKEVIKSCRKIFRKAGIPFTYTRRGHYRSVIISDSPIKENEMLKKMIPKFEKIIQEERMRLLGHGGKDE